MADYFNAFEKALFGQLSSQVTLSTVYQHVPQDTPPPVSIIGDISAEARGSKDGDLYLVEIDIVSVIRGPARKPLTANMAQIRSALEGWQPEMSEGQASALVALGSTAQLTEDGVTYVGSQRFSTFLQS